MHGVDVGSKRGRSRLVRGDHWCVRTECCVVAGHESCCICSALRYKPDAAFICMLLTLPLLSLYKTDVCVRYQ